MIWTSLHSCAAKPKKPKAQLVSGGVVSALGKYTQRRQARWWGNFNLDSAPGAVVTAAWFISEDVSVTQFHAHFGGDIG